MIFYFFFTALIAVLYGLLQFTLSRKWDRISMVEEEDMVLPNVSVIVPVRNEEANIEACLKSLSQQEYAPAGYEIIVVDNHSTDGTLKVCRNLCSSIPYLTVIDLSEFLPAEKAFKKEALRAGIDRAKGSYILTTDGDCTVPFSWVSTMMKSLSSSDVSFVTGPIKIKSDPGFLSQYQAIDLAGMMVATGGGINWGKLILANGANMGFSKKKFDAFGGYQDHISTASGDDVFLIQKLHGEDADSVRFVKNTEAMVLTGFESNLSNLFRQRKRWAAKTGMLKHIGTKAISVLVFVNSIWILAHIPLMIIFGQYALVALTIHLSFKILADQGLIGRGLTYFSINAPTYMIIAAHVLNPLLNVAIGLSVLISKNYTWKDRPTK